MESAELTYWRWLGDCGFKLVIIGCFVEVVAAASDFTLEKKFRDLWKRWKSCLRLSEFVGGAILIAGLVLEYKGHGEETKILDDANAKLHERASTNELARVEFEKQLLETKTQLANAETRLNESVTNLANLDRTKQPLTAVRAEVRISLTATQGLPLGDLVFPAILELKYQTQVMNPRIVLRARAAVKVTERIENSMYSMNFTDAIRPSVIAGIVPIGSGTNAFGSSVLYNAISIKISNFPVSNAVVGKGSAVITFNEIIQKRYLLNPGEIIDGQATLIGEANTNAQITIIKSR
jgi:hypothetical protein